MNCKHKTTYQPRPISLRPSSRKIPPPIKLGYNNIASKIYNATSKARRNIRNLRTAVNGDQNYWWNRDGTGRVDPVSNYANAFGITEQNMDKVFFGALNTIGATLPMTAPLFSPAYLAESAFAYANQKPHIPTFRPDINHPMTKRIATDPDLNWLSQKKPMRNPGNPFDPFSHPEMNYVHWDQVDYDTPPNPSLFTPKATQGELSMWKYNQARNEAQLLMDRANAAQQAMSNRQWSTPKGKGVISVPTTPTPQKKS